MNLFRKVDLKTLRGLSLTALLLVSSLYSKAQLFENKPFDSGPTRDFTWGEYDNTNFNLTNYPKDPTAQAVVIKEFGKAWITSNGNVPALIFEYHVKIKLFDSRALRKGHIEIPYYIQDNGSYEEINPESVHGITYYAAPDGAMRTAMLSSDSVAIIKKNKHWSAIVFTMPHLTKGCIIEYKYRLTSPYLDKFKTWEFQSDIPKLYSEYEAHIPTIFNYYVSLRGALSLSKDTVNFEKNCFSSVNNVVDCRVEDYRINEIPAFKPEPFIASAKNYLSALYFQVAQSTKLDNYTKTTSLNTMFNNNVVLMQSSAVNVANNWDEADKTLKLDDNFGAQLNRKPIPKAKLEQLTAGITDTLEKAKAIYTYIQKNISFDGLNNVYCDNGVKRALDKHTGNAADINISLTDALNEAGIRSDAVLISTRENGVVNNMYPALTEFNSVITATLINNKAYLLDATDPLIPFGILPFKDLTDKGRVMPLDNPSYWIDIIAPQRNINTAVADLTFDGNKLAGTINCYAKSYAAYKKRAKLAAYRSQNTGQTIPGLTVLSANDNATEQSPVLTQTYQVQVSNQSKTDGFTFTPFMLGKPVVEPFELLDTLVANPFVAAKRNYPIDFGTPAAYSFTFNLHLPAGYKIDNSPQNITLKIPGIGGMDANFTSDGVTAIYTITYNLDKAVYDVAEYDSLKNLFAKIVLAENVSVHVKKQ